ncbi:PSP1 domain-containing protein [Capnocytophaga canimorsus]|uniref:Stage 0 sporulation protein yaaT n=1 Tax=Capnocytophaga canimorsus TaxID=28188 RepID=A0A0B7ING4_9FLAO|nr:regulatory iron-sulfur-containing complex subunit RicT [Capnocytophaga canimorsus]CEN46529.1 Stage 0 sporulation protein yaaT [Capnocytophaga canimorsus]CEN51528.1 Stage 0 sporulation protein yaaT [Capnocytophaga canimorsus]VEJ19635.1 PSP1 C-terminal conserved region [Capnocytophaga canimorsus]
MSCSSCTTDINSPKGCKNNGVCGTDGCNKLSVFDWLSNLQMPGGEVKFDCVEVRFKNSRKEYFRNSENLPLQMGDVVATEANPGHDVGIVTLTGELVRLQMKKNKVNWHDEKLPKVYRKANQKDLDIWQEVRAKEEKVQKQSRELAIALGLEMKISDVEFQGDGSKATFYYTAEERVDFRQLIKDMAKTFSTRIEMRQIGFRQEASRLGGIGSCGRELCCSTWLTDFRSVTTAAARYQQLSLNPQKLAGQCGKLKCCLNYELDTYLDALRDFPKMETKLLTEKGRATCQKIDIFKRFMWFTYDDESINWHKLTVDQVNEIITQNKKGVKIAALEDFALAAEETTLLPEFQNVVGQDSLTRFDNKKNKRSKNKKRRKPKDKTPNTNNKK